LKFTMAGLGAWEGSNTMKRMTWITIAAVVLAGSLATAQSLGDAARAVRKDKDKGTQAPASRHFDNDNLPQSDHLSVVGAQSDASAAATQTADASAPAQAATTQPAAATSNDSAAAAPAAAKDPKADAENRDRINQEWKKKIESAKQNIDSLTHELDITEREYRLKAVAMYSDAGNRLRNSAEWDKEDAQYKEQIEAKQKALDQAKQNLEEMQEQARKAGVPSSMRGE
jgi:hypothetical protein